MAGNNQWSSRLAFIVAASGSAVGLGNVWKFPFMAGQNGGGAFVMVYLLCVLFLGLPLLMAEMSLGRYTRLNAWHACESLSQLRHASRHWKWLGGMSILSGALVLSYYSVIAGWICDYALRALTVGVSAPDPLVVEGFFNTLLSQPRVMIMWHTVVMFSTMGVVALGVERGLEKANYLAFSGMLILLLVLLVYAAFEGAFTESLQFLFVPRWKDFSGHALILALGHAFFTIGLGMGILIQYGAYTPQNVKIAPVAMIIVIVDTVVALLAALVIFPMVFAHHLSPAMGPSLIFKTLPIAFGHMPFGEYVAPAFFAMLFLAAFTSTIALLEPSVSFCMQQWGWTRPQAAIINGFVIGALGVCTALSFKGGFLAQCCFGLSFFSVLDGVVSNFMLPLGGMGLAIFVGRHIGNTSWEALLGKWPLFSRLSLWLLRWVAPVAIVCLMGNALWDML